MIVTAPFRHPQHPKSAAMVLSSFVGDFKMIYQENLDQLLEALGKHPEPVTRINENAINP